MSEKLQSKILSRVSHLDCEDMIDLVRYLSKIRVPESSGIYRTQKIRWVQEVMLEIAKRVETTEYLHESRTLYTLDNWLSFMINVNVAYQNVIIASGESFIEGLEKANQKLGDILSEEAKRLALSPVSQTQENQVKIKDVLTLFEQLSRFKLSNPSILKELQNKLIGLVFKTEHYLNMLHTLTRIEKGPITDTKTLQIINKLANSINSSLSTLTYEQIGVYLESLLLNGFKPSAEFSQAIVLELENRQKQMLQGGNADEKVEQSQQDRLKIQEAIKIIRSMMQLGCNHEVNRSHILLKTLTNILHKNKEKMTTGQTADAQLFLRQAMLYPVGQNLHVRLLNQHTQLREQFESKLFKVQCGRLLFTLIQDRFIRDSHKLMQQSSKEVKGNLAKALLRHIDQLNYPNEINLVSQVFSKAAFEESKFVGIALSEINKRAKDVKESLISKKTHGEVLFKELEALNKLIYLVCFQESTSALQNKVTPDLILGREQWAEVSERLKNLKSIGAFTQYKGDYYSQEVAKFQQLILDDKFDITGFQGAQGEQGEDKKQGFSRIEKVKSALETKLELGKKIETKVDIILSAGVKFNADLYIPELNLALQTVEPVKIPHDVRFIEKKSIVELNKLNLEGSEDYTMSRQVIQAYEEGQLNMMQAYYLRYFKGITLKLADHRKLKDPRQIEFLLDKGQVQ